MCVYMKLLKNFKAQTGLNAMVPTIITFVIVAVVAVLGLQLLGDQADDQAAETLTCAAGNATDCNAGYNATQDAIDGVSKFPEKLPMIASVLVLVLIIGILIAAFAFKRR